MWVSGNLMATFCLNPRGLMTSFKVHTWHLRFFMRFGLSEFTSLLVNLMLVKLWLHEASYLPLTSAHTTSRGFWDSLFLVWFPLPCCPNNLCLVDSTGLWLCIFRSSKTVRFCEVKSTLPHQCFFHSVYLVDKNSQLEVTYSFCLLINVTILFWSFI